MVAKGADDVLKLEVLNCSTSHALSFGTFSATGMEVLQVSEVSGPVA